MGTSHGDFIKFPRTPHVAGSTGTDDDRHLTEATSRRILSSPDLVCTEKVDGANVAVHFSAAGDLILQCRGHILGEREHPQFNMLKTWAYAQRERLASALGVELVLFGEWLYCVHHVRYDALPHYFVVFDVLDKMSSKFLDTETVERVAARVRVPVVPELHRGSVEPAHGVARLVGQSRFGNTTMEGVYLKTESAGVVTARAKWVRPDFTRTVKASWKTWRRRAPEMNALVPGTDIWA